MVGIGAARTLRLQWKELLLNTGKSTDQLVAEFTNKMNISHSTFQDNLNLIRERVSRKDDPVLKQQMQKCVDAAKLKKERLKTQRINKKEKQQSEILASFTNVNDLLSIGIAVEKYGLTGGSECIEAALLVNNNLCHKISKIDLENVELTESQAIEMAKKFDITVEKS